MAAQQLQLRYKVVAMDGQCALDPVWQHSSLQGLSVSAAVDVQLDENLGAMSASLARQTCQPC